MRVVAELCEHPGTEDLSQARLGQHDLSVRVPAKMRLHLPLQSHDLFVEHDQDRGQSTGRDGVSLVHDSGLGQVLGPQRRLDPGSLVGNATAASTLERRADLGGGQPGRRGRVRGLGQQLESVGSVQVLESHQRGREVVPQRVPQPLAGPGPFPDQCLVDPGNDLDRLHVGGVTGHRAQLMGIGTDHVGQHVRVARVTLSP